MNNDSGSSANELVDKNCTQEKGVQVDDSDKKDVIKTDALIDLNTEEECKDSQDFNRLKYLEESREKELLNRTLEPENKESRRTGLRSDHTVEL